MSEDIQISNHLASGKELDESSALALAAKYFGFARESPSTLTERQSDYAIDPVTPFDDMPDPDAPSKAEMMENFSKRGSSSVSLKSAHSAQTAQLAMHNFFIPSPSPMYEQPAVVEHSSQSHTTFREGSPANTRRARSPERDVDVKYQSEPAPKVAAFGLSAVKSHAISVRKHNIHNANADENFAKSQHGIFNIFEDHAVSISGKKAKAIAAIEAKHIADNSLVSSTILRKSTSNQAEQVLHDPKVSQDRSNEATHAAVSGAAATQHSATAAAKDHQHSAPDAQHPNPRQTRAEMHEGPSHVDAKPKRQRATVDYGGVFGDPFEDNAVDATAARQGQPSWF